MPLGIKIGRIVAALTVATLLPAINPSLAQVNGGISRSNSIPSSELNEWTDFIFGLVHPEMEGRVIQPHQTQYKQEWLAIREALKDKLVWTQMLCVDDSYGYHLTDYKEAITAISDAVFHVRHPELGGRQIQPYETELIREWESISDNFPLSLC